MNLSTSAHVPADRPLRVTALGPDECPPYRIQVTFAYNASAFFTTFEAEQLITILQGALAELSDSQAVAAVRT